MRKTSQEVFQTMETRSVAGVVLDALNEASVERTQENYEKIKDAFLAFPCGEVSVEQVQEKLSLFLEKNEVILTTFRKVKKNGKVGKRKEFSKGFYYYIGQDREKLSKIYVHWEEEKRFTLDNIVCLNVPILFVEKQTIQLMKNSCGIFLSFSTPEKVLLAELCIYVGYFKFLEN